MFRRVKLADNSHAGIAYQLIPEDPLLDTTQCTLDAALMKTLGTNAIRVYHVDPKFDHSGCMAAFANAGIYIMVDMDTFTTYILPVSRRYLLRSDLDGSHNGPTPPATCAQPLNGWRRSTLYQAYLLARPTLDPWRVSLTVACATYRAPRRGHRRSSMPTAR